MTDLPAFTNVFTKFATLPTVANAYCRVLSLEKMLQSEEDYRKLVCLRVLGYLLLYAPSTEARVAVARRVVSSNDAKTLIAHGKWYYNNYILPFRIINIDEEPWPTPYIGPFCATIKEMSTAVAVKTPMNNHQARMNALVRDEFCCVVTGLYDLSSLDHNAELKAACRAENQHSSGTDCASFFKYDPHLYLLSPSLWEVMNEFGYTNVAEGLRGHNMFRLENIVTLSLNVHDGFNRLNLWFEPTEDKNFYTVQTATPDLFMPGLFRPAVTFTTPDRKEFPLPSKEYISIQGACAKVAQLSGAALYITETLDNVENWDSGLYEEDGALSEKVYQSLRL